MQFHDEIAVVTPDTKKTDHELLQALDKTNRDIKLNVTLAIDVKAGNNYAEVH
jgi:DNA polymerase I-like protein with 3'-5' exonuclease and polymerase domains